jgi:hypothetical protein
MQREGIAFVQHDNVFTDCANPERLQQLSDAFASKDLEQPVEAFLAKFCPFFSEAEREEGYRHQLYMNQMEYCHNLLFHKPAAAQRLFDRLMDANRAMGRPDKLAITFGRKNFRPCTRDGHIFLKMTPTRVPVLSAGFQHTVVKQYIGPSGNMRTEASSHQLKDLSVPKPPHGGLPRGALLCLPGRQRGVSHQGFVA